MGSNGSARPEPRFYDTGGGQNDRIKRFRATRALVLQNGGRLKRWDQTVPRGQSPGFTTPGAVKTIGTNDSARTEPGLFRASGGKSDRTKRFRVVIARFSDAGGG